MVALYAAFLSRFLQARTILGAMALGFSVLGRAPMFLAGIAAAWLYLHRGPALRHRLANSTLLQRGGADLVLLAVLIVLAYLLRWVVWMGQLAEHPSYQVWHVLEASLWATVLLLLLLAPLRLKPLFSNRLFNRLGVLSYSIYVLHLPVIVFSLRLLRRWWPSLSGWNARSAIAALLISVTCIALAELTYRGIERPFLARKERVRT
jgi:peptidoglycan/LPS O-acetylase OafA/YrhL